MDLISFYFGFCVKQYIENGLVLKEYSFFSLLQMQSEDFCFGFVKLLHLCEGGEGRVCPGWFGMFGLTFDRWD